MTKYNVLIDISVGLSCVDDTYRGSYLSVLPCMLASSFSNSKQHHVFMGGGLNVLLLTVWINTF